MSQHQETIATWNKLALLYEQKFMHLPIYNHTYDALLQECPSGNLRLLDVGCGPGNVSWYLCEKHKQLNVYGIDAAESMIERAKIHLPLASFEVLDGRKITEISGMFDVVVSGFFIPYLDENEVREFFDAVQKKLHANGLFYLSYVPGSAEQSGFQTGSTGDRVYFHFHPKHTVLRFLEEVGFRLLHQFEVEYVRGEESTEIHEVLILRKGS